MNKFSKLLVTAAILPGMVDAPIALANDLEDKNKATAGKIKSSDAIQDSLKTLKLASTPVLENNVAVQDDDPVEQGTVIINYVDESNNPMGLSDEIKGNIGDKYTTRPKKFGAYSYYEVKDNNETGYFSATSQTVTYVYYPQPTANGVGWGVVIDYIDELGNMITGSDFYGGLPGESYTTHPMVIDGYTFKEVDTSEYYPGVNYSPESGVITDMPAEPWVRFIYSADIEVEYYTEASGGELRLIPDSTEILSGHMGDSYTSALKDFDNRTFYKMADDSALTTGSFTGSPQTIKYIYRYNPDFLIEYVDESGNEIIPPESQQGAFGASYNVKPKAIDGWTYKECSSNNLAGTYPTMDDYLGNTGMDSVVLVYTKSAQPITVSYVDENNNPIPGYESIPNQGAVGHDFNASAEDIPGYTFKEVNVNGYVSTNRDVTLTFSDNAQQVTYVYTKNAPQSEKVTIEYVDQDMNPIATAPSVEKSGEIGKQLTESPIIIDGYTFLEAKVDGITSSDANGNVSVTYDESEHKITFVYLNNIYGSITFDYVDKEGNKLLDSNTKYGQKGAIEHITPDENVVSIEKYTLKEIIINGNAWGWPGYWGIGYRDEPTHIQFVYEKNAGPLTINYIDQATGLPVHDSKVVDNLKIGDSYTATPENVEEYFCDGTLGASETVTITDQPQEITYYYTAKRYVTFEYVDAVTHEILQETKVDGRYGESCGLNIIPIDGYRFKQVVGNYPGDMVMFTEEPQTVVIEYSKLGYISVEYVDENDDPIDGFNGQDYTGVVGENYPDEAAPIDIPGYTWFNTQGQNSDSTFIDGHVTITHRYTKDAEPITVSYVDENNDPIPGYETLQYPGAIGHDFNDSALDIQGYTFKEVDVNGSVSTNKDVTLTFSGHMQYIKYVYVKTAIPAMPIEFEYVEVDELGNRTMISKEIISDKIVGDKITKAPRIIDGYTFKETNGDGVIDENGQITITFTEEWQRVYFIYTKDLPTEVEPIESADVTIIYEDEHGNAIPGYNVKTENGIIGETLECAAESIAGYTFKEVKINGDVSIDPDVKVTYTDKPQTITFVYVMNPVAEPEEGRVTVNYVDEDGNTIAKSDSQIGLVGNAYTTSPKAIKGYTFKEVKGQATGTYIHDEVTVTYVYSKNASDTIVPPVNSNDNQNDSTVVPPVNGGNDQTNSTIIPPVNDDGGKTMVIEEAHSANTETNLTNPVQAESLPYAVQDGEHPELPETHANHKVALTVVGLLTALVIGMTSVIRPKKKQ